MKTRLLNAALALGLIIGGTGAIAKAGGKAPLGGSPRNSANSQYCPPSSPGGGKPKKPGPAKCGKADSRRIEDKRHKRKHRAGRHHKKRRQKHHKRKHER